MYTEEKRFKLNKNWESILSDEERSIRFSYILSSKGLSNDGKELTKLEIRFYYTYINDSKHSQLFL